MTTAMTPFYSKVELPINDEFSQGLSRLAKASCCSCNEYVKDVIRMLAQGHTILMPSGRKRFKMPAKSKFDRTWRTSVGSQQRQELASLSDNHEEALWKVVRAICQLIAGGTLTPPRDEDDKSKYPIEFTMAAHGIFQSQLESLAKEQGMSPHAFLHMVVSDMTHGWELVQVRRKK